MTTQTAVSIEGIVDKISSFLETQSIRLDDVGEIHSFPLLESGALDSLGILHLMMFLAEEYQLEVEDEDFTPENFATASTLAAFISQRASAA